MDELETLVFEALGQASMCWSETPKGVFDSEQAKKIGENLIAAIKAREEKAIIEAHRINVIGPSLRYEPTRDHRLEQ
jgi:hypothetical protein